VSLAPPAKIVSLRAAAGRGVDHADFAGAGGDGLDRFRACRGMHHQRGTRPHRGHQGAVQADLPDLFVGEHADHHDVGPATELVHVAHRVGSAQLRDHDAVRPSAQDPDVVAGIDDPDHHGPSHPARTDETDFHRALIGVSHQGQDGVGHVEHGAPAGRGPLGEFDDQPDVLLQQRPGQAGQAGQAVQAANPAKSVEREAVCAAARNDFDEPIRRDAHRVGQRQRRGRRAQVGGEQQVVEQFGGLPRSRVAEVNDGVGVRFEDRTAALDDLGIAADHHQQAALRGRRTAAADRRVDDRNTMRSSPFREPAASVGMHRAVYRDDAARRHRRQRPVLAAGQFLDVGIADDAEADQIACRAQIGRRRGEDGRRIGKRLERCAPARPQRRLVAAPSRIRRAIGPP
jgi:hypothetical protein